MKFVVLALLFALLSVNNAENDQEAFNACNTVSSTLTTTANAVPFIPIANTIFHTAMKIIGGYRMEKLAKKVQLGVEELELAFLTIFQQLNDLETLVNDRFNEIEAFIDRKQFETDITDPSTILWGKTLAFLNASTTSNRTRDLLWTECYQQTPWQIATKIHNRLYGPDNTLMTQIKANHYSNQSFMNTKDELMYRMFQMMSVQAACLGLQYGEDYNITNDWEMQRIGNIYDSVVSNIIDVRKQQEDDYWPEVKDICNQAIMGGGSFSDVEFRIRNTLDEQYPWENFFVSINSLDAPNKLWYYGFKVDNTAKDRSVKTNPTGAKVEALVVRYWARTFTDDERTQYTDRVKTKVSQMACPDYEIPGRLGFADNSSIAIYSLRKAVNNEKAFGSSVGNESGVIKTTEKHDDGDLNFVEDYVDIFEIFTLPERPGNIAYDLGFWIREINMTFPSLPTTTMPSTTTTLTTTAHTSTAQATTVQTPTTTTTATTTTTVTPTTTTTLPPKSTTALSTASNTATPMRTTRPSSSEALLPIVNVLAYILVVFCT